MERLAQIEIERLGYVEKTLEEMKAKLLTEKRSWLKFISSHRKKKKQIDFEIGKEKINKEIEKERNFFGEKKENGEIDFATKVYYLENFLYNCNFPPFSSSKFEIDHGLFLIL